MPLPENEQPLSEDERRILLESEQQLIESDPELARAAVPSRRSGYNPWTLRLSALGFVGGAAFMIATIGIHYLLAFVGFVVMFGAALAFERGLRELGRSSWEHLAGSVGSAGLRDYIGNAGERMRGHFEDERTEDEDGGTNRPS